MRRLLVVEHNPLFRDGLALLLKWHTGLSSVYAGSLAEARRILDEEDQKPACIIVDLDLPDGDGTALLKQLKGLPVLALIRHQNPIRRAEAIGLGAAEVLDMTGSTAKIAVTVERLVGPRSITY
jgi:DNA-binding NarL/FixJ family response regulator